MIFLKMTPLEIIDYARKSEANDIIDALKSDISEELFKLIFFNIKDEIKDKLLDDDLILSKIILMVKNNSKTKVLKNFSNSFILQLLSKVNEKDLALIVNALPEDKLQNIIDFINKILENKESNCNKDALCKLKEKLIMLNYNYDLYIKYGLKMKTVVDENVLIIEGKYKFPYDFLLKINDKRINKLLEIAKLTNPGESDAIIFFSIIKMYLIFGYDNVYKILQNKFTYRTEASIIRYAEANFVDLRRQFRLENQALFYSYDLATKAFEALKNKDLDFFRPYVREQDEQSFKNFIQNLEIIFQKFSTNKNEKILRNIFEQLFKTEIIEREKNLKERYIKNMLQKYNLNAKRNPIGIAELYRIFANVNISRFKLDDSGKIILDKTLNRFLLGNAKTDNDALLRLVFNKDAFGLNTTLDDVINDFSKISYMIYHNKNLSLNSILDVIDVCKAKSFNLLPNEKGMTLDTVSEIMKSLKHCTESKEELFRRARKLYVESQSKVASSIPLINGISKSDIKYNVINFDNAELLTLGINAGCCLKVGGKGEEFLNYLMKSPHGYIITLQDENNNIFICPFIRNGNGVFGNGLDPAPYDRNLSDRLLETLKEIGQNMISKSYDDEKIEFVTITDLHLEEFLKEKNLPRFKVDKYLPLDAVFYSDYHKKDKINYIVAAISSNVVHKSYEPKKLFYEERKEPFIFDSSNNDKERIEQLINSINYSSISFQHDLTETQKNRQRRNYKYLNVADFNFIIGNKDWFIGIKDFETISVVLPYDFRARNEYFKALEDIKEKYSEPMRR